MAEQQNGYEVFKPTLWQRIRWWERWPWRPTPVAPSARTWAANWVTIVRQGAAIVGWHLDEDRPCAVIIAPSRWACLYGLVTGRLIYEAEINPGTRQPPAEAAR